MTFYPLTDTEIHAYLDTAEYADKAGAYGIQGQGALLIEAIAGDYYAIMGLPIAKVARLLKELTNKRQSFHSSKEKGLSLLCKLLGACLANVVSLNPIN